jgi:hypothetical protein
MSDVRCQRPSEPGPSARARKPHPSVIRVRPCSLRPVQAPPRRCSRIGLHAYPCPGPTIAPKERWPDLLHGHDSLHDVIRSEVRGQMSDRERARHGPPASTCRTPAPAGRARADVVLRQPSFCTPFRWLRMPEVKRCSSPGRRPFMPDPGAF